MDTEFLIGGKNKGPVLLGKMTKDVHNNKISSNCVLETIKFNTIAYEMKSLCCVRTRAHGGRQNKIVTMKL